MVTYLTFFYLFLHSPSLYYSCPTHGRYREYQDSLIGFKDWCIVMVTISIIPLGLIVFETGIDLNWIFYSGAIITIPCFPPVILSIIWVKATGKGLISGETFVIAICLLFNPLQNNSDF